jgi:CRP/FNR family transcriptional regulator
MYDLDSLVTRMRTVSHFKRMAEADLKAIASGGQIRRYATGTTIFTEGEPAAGMYVLNIGRVHLMKLGPQGQQSIIDVIEPVIMFNEVTALDGGVNLTTAVAVQDCVTWNIDYENFQSLMQRFPQLGLGLLRVLATRNRNLVSMFEDLSFRTVVARAAKLLLDLSDNGKRQIDRREHQNQELAARVATVPEAFSRSLRLLREHHLITCSHLAIIINDSEGLAQLAQVQGHLFKV